MRRTLLIALAVVAMACLPYPEPRPYDPGADDAASLYAPYRRDGYFETPWRPFSKGALDLVRWMLTRNPYDKSAAPQVEVVANSGADLAGRQNSARITWVGHATFAIHDGDDVVLTDPHFGHRALVPARYFPPGVPIEAVPDDALAVVSHNHYDHLDAYTVDTLAPSVRWFVPLGLADWFRARGRDNVVELGWWESARHGRWTMTCLPAQHWSRRIGQGTNETLWCSWLLESGDYRYYFAGDTGYFHGFAEFGRRFGPIDVAMLPIGAYEPRWFMREQHMDPAEAYRGFLALGARLLLQMQCGRFDLTPEPVDEAPKALRRAVEEAGATMDGIEVMAIGGSWHVPERATASLGPTAQQPRTSP